MSIPNPNSNQNKRGMGNIILRSQIEEAQRHTNSNMAAARWLGVSYDRYKKYATLYGIFERHLNVNGKGVDKGFSKKPTSIPLNDILAGKHPKYSLAKLKNRLIARNKIAPECALCGFHEKRITDGQTPLMLRFLDGDRQNFQLANLQLYCYNCMFLTTGAPHVVYRKHIKRSFTEPELISKRQQLPPLPTDALDPVEDAAMLHNIEYMLTDEEKDSLLQHLDG